MPMQPFALCSLQAWSYTSSTSCGAQPRQLSSLRCLSTAWQALAMSAPEFRILHDVTSLADVTGVRVETQRRFLDRAGDPRLCEVGERECESSTFPQMLGTVRDCYLALLEVVVERVLELAQLRSFVLVLFCLHRQIEFVQRLKDRERKIKTGRS